MDNSKNSVIINRIFKLQLCPTKWMNVKNIQKPIQIIYLSRNSYICVKWYRLQTYRYRPIMSDECKY